MPIRTAIWTVDDAKPTPLTVSSLQKEQTLEKMIVAAPQLLSSDWMLIGQQEDTGFGGRIDLLAIEQDGSLVLIELKRDRTPREVVAQALDYASWVEGLGAADVDAIYGRFAPGRKLADDFLQRFGQSLDDDVINRGHQIIIVAAALDDSTERIVTYLSKRDIAINVLCFQVFTYGAEQLLSRAWLLDPVRVQASSAATADAASEPWNGEFYCNYGLGNSRSWPEAVQYSFISAGGGPFFTRTFKQLVTGGRVWVNCPGAGYIGVCRVTGHAQPANAFTVTTPAGEQPALDVLKGGTYHRDWVNDPEQCEYFVPVRWLQTVPVEQAVKESGLFGNQNTICKPTSPKWRTTVERLKVRFADHNK